MQASDLEIYGIFFGPLFASLIALTVLPKGATTVRLILYLFNAVWVLFVNFSVVAMYSWLILKTYLTMGHFPAKSEVFNFIAANAICGLCLVPFWFSCLTYGLVFFVFSAGWQWFFMNWKGYPSVEALD
jgi:hypothetical protein